MRFDVHGQVEIPASTQGARHEIPGDRSRCGRHSRRLGFDVRWAAARRSRARLAAGPGTWPAGITAENAKQLGEQLRERLKAAGLPGVPALVSIGRDKIILKELKYPPVDAAQESSMTSFQALKEITESPDEIVLDYAPITDAAADPAAERRAMAVVVRKEVFDAVAEMVEAAGAEAGGHHAAAYAAAAGLAHALSVHKKARRCPA